MRIGPRFNVSCTRVTTSDGHSISLPWVDKKVIWVDTPRVKKQDTKLLPITSPNINRFSKFLHWQTQR